MRNRELGRHWLVVAVGGGVLLGVVDLTLQRTLPYPWANLANSSAVWAAVAFAAGRWVRGGVLRSLLAGVLLLPLAVEAYYLAAALALGDDVRNLWTPVAVVWMAFGVLAGAVFGAAGGLSRHGVRWVRASAAAMPAAVLFAEAAVLVVRPSMDAAYRANGLMTAAIEVALGAGLLLLAARPDRLRALVAALVLAPIGFAGFLAAGFAG